MSLDNLARQYPGWTIAIRWQAAASGPDWAAYTATRDGITLFSLSLAGLAAELSEWEGEEEPGGPRDDR